MQLSDAAHAEDQTHLSNWCFSCLVPKEWGEEGQTCIENILEILNFVQIL